MTKPRARVTAVYEIALKAAPHLERLLREEIPREISCAVLEVSHAEQVPLEDEVDWRAHKQGAGLIAELVYAGEDGELGGAAGQGEREPGGGGEDVGVLRPVPPQEQGDLIDLISGAREVGNQTIVPQGD